MVVLMAGSRVALTVLTRAAQTALYWADWKVD